MVCGRVPSECLPIVVTRVRDCPLDRQAHHAEVFASAEEVVLRLKSRKNRPHGSRRGVVVHGASVLGTVSEGSLCQACQAVLVWAMQAHVPGACRWRIFPLFAGGCAAICGNK